MSQYTPLKTNTQAIAIMIFLDRTRIGKDLENVDVPRINWVDKDYEDQ